MEFINKVFNCKECNDLIGYSSTVVYEAELCSKCSDVKIND